MKELTVREGPANNLFIEGYIIAIYQDINNPSSFTWEIGVSKPEVGANPSLNRGSAETGSTLPRVWIRLVPGER